MKILYLFTSARIRQGSVQNKVLKQIEALNTENDSCIGVFFTTDEFKQSESPYFEFKHVKKVDVNFFRSSRQKTTYHQSVLKFVQENSSQFDCIYYRYPGAHPLLAILMKNVPNKIFFEHVTAETEEIKMYKKENPFIWNLSSFLSLYEFYWKPLIYEYVYGKSIRKGALFGICNSEDISNHEKKHHYKKYKTIVLGDAVKSNAFQTKLMKPIVDSFAVAFLKGAGTSAEFNGLDRIFKGLSNYKGPLKINFFLHGDNLETEKALIHQLGIEDKVKLGGFIDKNEIDLLFEKVNMCFGALAVHRKGLSSTTTIKTREYFARGMPFVFAHHDPDFSENPEAMKYCLQLSANDEAVNFEEIINWYNKLDKSDHSSKKMHDFAVQKLDYKVKMKKLKEYIYSFLKN